MILLFHKNIYAYRLESASVKKVQYEFAVRNRNNEMHTAAAFGGIYLGMRLMRGLIKNNGVDIFAYYSLGAALFTFILFLNI